MAFQREASLKKRILIFTSVIFAYHIESNTYKFGATKESNILCHILCLLAGYLICIVSSLWAEEVKNDGMLPDRSKVYLCSI